MFIGPRSVEFALRAGFAIYAKEPIMNLNKSSLLVAISVVLFAISGLLFLHLPKVHAQASPASTQAGSITGFGTCWSAECVVLATNAPYVDNGCNGTATAQYATAPGAAGNSIIHASLLGAMLSGKKVALVVQGCIFGHPQIIGVGVAP
jgi:hypothetical protein